MITAIVSAIKGPILSVLSGCLGESGMLRLWLWNLVPTQANMPGIVTFPGNCRATYVGFVFLRCSGKSRQALVRGRDSDL